MANCNNFSSLSTKKGFKLTHLNVRSLLNKVDQLRVNFAEAKIEIITISETWLRESHPTQSIDLKGYVCFRQDRHGPNTKNKGGGLVAYLQNKLANEAVNLSKLNICNFHIEAQWIKVQRKCAKNIILCNLYRPPDGDLAKAIEYMTKSLQSVNSAKNDIFIMGDWNVNYKNTLSPNYKKIVYFENYNNLKQTIKETSRNTDRTKTLLDLILTNADHITDSGTIDMFISDHQPVYVIKKKSRNTPDAKEFEGRSYKHLDTDLLLYNLFTRDWRQNQRLHCLLSRE